MNINKVQLGVQLSLKQQTALKCMQFATQYLLKKAQYRLLNPLHLSGFNLSQLNKNSQLMAQLSQYSTKKPLLPSKIGNINNNTNKPQKQIEFSPYSPQSPQRQIKQSQTKPKPKSKLRSSIPQQSLNLIKQQPQPKPQSSVSQYDHLQFQRTSSQIINNRSSQQSISSKKSKSKFQKVIKSNKKLSSQTFPQQNFNFKKIKPPQIQKKSSKQSNLSQSIKSRQKNISQIKKSKQINVQQNEKKFDIKFSDSDSDDSFENFPLPSQQKQKNNQKQIPFDIIKSEDMKSYRSSILSEKKVDFGVVSQHPSQHQISILNESQIIPNEKGQNEESIRTDKIKTDNNDLLNIINVSKIQPFSKMKQNKDTQKFIKNQQQNYQQQQTKQIDDKQNEQKSHNQSQVLKQQQRQKEQYQKNQIRKHLLKLQSFDVQQQILIKKILKIWNKDSNTLNTLKNIQWNQLNLPKPSFKFNTHLYAQIIE